ncbi:hypothetical protein VPH35_034845 [Triticum aestivum]
MSTARSQEKTTIDSAMLKSGLRDHMDVIKGKRRPYRTLGAPIGPGGGVAVAVFHVDRGSRLRHVDPTAEGGRRSRKAIGGSGTPGLKVRGARQTVGAVCPVRRHAPYKKERPGGDPAPTPAPATASFSLPPSLIIPPSPSRTRWLLVLAASFSSLLVSRGPLLSVPLPGGDSPNKVFGDWLEERLTWRMYKARRQASLKVRRRVGKYELGRTIGEGTFAKVRFAKDTESGDPVAIKILDKAKVHKHGLVEQIRREICTMKLIQHPNVVRLHEVMGSKARIFIVLEYVTGGELHDIIAARGSLKEDEARRYFQQLINAVDYCHSRGVYHRDLKLENLLLDTAGNLKVSDFGLSAISEQAKADGLLHTTCGTPNYVAPEVIQDKGYNGALADLWSCGVILFVMLAGYLPFEDDNVSALYKKISGAQFTCPSWFSDGAKRLIPRILDPNPSTRITIPQLLKDPWFKKGYKPPVFDEKHQTSLDDVDAAFGDSEEKQVEEEMEGQPASMNAFELISLNKGLNLRNFFEADKKYRRETRFTSQCPPEEIISRIEEAAKPLGFDIQKKNYKMRMKNLEAGRKGNLNVATEVRKKHSSLRNVFHNVMQLLIKDDISRFSKWLHLCLLLS